MDRSRWLQVALLLALPMLVCLGCDDDESVTTPTGVGAAGGAGGTGGGGAGAGAEGFVPVGYEGSIPARHLDAADRARIAALGLQDLLDSSTGRYCMLEDDGVLGTWGLDQLTARRAATTKPYSDLRDGNGVYQSERVVFADLSTGAMMMKLTNQPHGDGADEIIYFGKSAFSADGSRMIWSRVDTPSLWGPGTQTIGEEYGPLLLDGDGARPRIAFDRGIDMGAVIAHPLAPDRGYAVSNGELLELDLTDGAIVSSVASLPYHWHLKMSPDGNYVCDASYGGAGIVVQSLTDSTQWTIPLTGAIHDSYRFVPGDTDWIMFWYEGNYPTTELYNFKTQEHVSLDLGFDWNHGDVGRHYGVHTTGNLYEWSTGTWTMLGGLHWPEATWQDLGPFYDCVVNYNGYLAHWPDEELWAYPTRILERPNLSEISSVFTKLFPAGGRSNRYRVCLTNLYRTTDWQGAEAVALDRPNISRDGTKILFNSNVFSQSEVYLVVAHKPRPPVDVAASWTAGGAQLDWGAPQYHQEIAGYHVYRSTESGRGLVQITDAPVQDTTYLDATAPSGTALFYAIRSVEHSALESELSVEVAVASEPSLLDTAPLRLFFEAEDALSATLAAPPPDAMWRNIDGLASNVHFLWQRRADIAGSASLNVTLPRADDYYVYARVKGARDSTTGSMFSAEVALTIAGLAIATAARDDWQWVRSTDSAPFEAGDQDITIGSETRGSCVDAVYLSTDADFTPEGRAMALPPGALTLTATTSAGHPLLSWDASNDPRFYYYNLYAADSSDFEIGRATLVASPDAPSYLDWQAPPGQYYRVTQVTRDGFESPPSAAVAP